MLKGSRHTPEWKVNASMRLRGHKTSKETRRKISKSHKGMKYDDAFKDKIRIARARQVITPKMLEALAKGRQSRITGVMKNPEYVSWLKNQWHHRRRNATGKHTFDEWELLKARFNWMCPRCKKREPEIKLTADHIIPLSVIGSSNNIENIQPLCQPCNSWKNKKTIKYEIN